MSQAYLRNAEPQESGKTHVLAVGMLPVRLLRLTACQTSEHSDYTSTERCVMRNLVLRGKTVSAVEAMQGTGLSEAGHDANMM